MLYFEFCLRQVIMTCSPVLALIVPPVDPVSRAVYINPTGSTHGEGRNGRLIMSSA